VISKNEGLVALQDYTLDRARLLDAITKYAPHAMCQAPPIKEHGEGMIDPIVSQPPPPPPDPKADSAEVSRGQRMAALKRVTGPSVCVTPGLRSWDLMEAGAESVRTSLSALADKLSHQPGRKSVFWMSQGFPVTQLRGEFETLWNKTISELNDANVQVNAIDSNGLDGPLRMWGFGEVLTMKRLAEDTGGQAYYGRNDLDGALASGIADSRSSYTLGFYLTEVDGKYHDLKVKVDRPGLTLNYRQGYYALDELKPDATKKAADLATALLNPSDLTAVGIVANLAVKPGKPREQLSVRLRLDPESLTLHDSKAGRTGKVEEMFVEFNAAGREVGKITAASTFNIAPENRAAFESKGVTLVQAFPLSAEAVKLSIIVRDTESGRVGSLTMPIDK
jgi:VWFA-related protein